MPDPYERHARPGRWDYASSQPPRSLAKAAAAQEPQGKRPPGRKDPDLCKAQHWKGSHTPELREVKAYRRGTMPCCYWAPSYTGREPWWFCCHEEVCSGCGKILEYKILSSRCPHYHEILPEEREWLAAETERTRELRAKWSYRKRPLITGPQGYRKKRDG